MNFVIIHFNTPELTACLCSSIRKNHKDSNIIIFDNSDKIPFKNKELFCDVYYDNTKSQIIDFNKEFENCCIDKSVLKLNKLGSAKHCRTIQWLFENLKLSEFILLDSDVLLVKPLDFVNNNYSCIAAYEQLKNMKPRLLPFITYFNLDKLNNINYFDKTRMNGLSNYGKPYDTGASFTEDLNNKNISYKKINYSDYLIHYKSGSWSSYDHKTEDFKMWLLKNSIYWKI